MVTDCGENLLMLSPLSPNPVTAFAAQLLGALGVIGFDAGDVATDEGPAPNLDLLGFHLLLLSPFPRLFPDRASGVPLRC